MLYEIVCILSMFLALLCKNEYVLGLNICMLNSDLIVLGVELTLLSNKVIMLLFPHGFHQGREKYFRKIHRQLYAVRQLF